MGERIHIGLDFDDTLLPMRERVEELLLAQRGEPAITTDTDFRISFRWGLDNDEFFAWFGRHHAALHDIAPFPAVAETLRQWSQTATLSVITGRRPDTLGFAQDWARRHDLPITHFHSAPAEGEKARCAAAHGVQWFVEDDDGNAEQFAAAGIHVLLFDRPYNQKVSHPLIHTVRDWNEISARADEWFAGAIADTH
jgi:uncharacterized HAD superfamily protein